MAQEFTQFREDRPVLRETPIADKSKGFEALSEAMGMGAHAIFKYAENLEESASSSHMLQSTVLANRMKTQAHANMLLHPDMTDQILEGLKSSLNMIKTNSVVNSGDRSRLNNSIENDLDGIEIKSAEIKRRNLNAQASVTFYNSLPALYTQYTHALNSSPEEAKTISDGLHKTVIGMVTQGALEPKQVANILAKFELIHDNHARTIEAFKRGDIEAHEHHAGTYNPFNETPLHQASLPGDVNTQLLVQHHSDDVSFRGIASKLSDPLYRPTAMDNEAVDRMSESENRRVFQCTKARGDAQALIFSGKPWQQIVREFVDSKSDKTDYGNTKHNYLNNYFKELYQGNYLSLISNTTIGSQTIQDYQNNLTALDKAALDPEEKEEWKQTYVNNFITKMNSVGTGLHMPTELVQPISKDILLPIRQGLVTNGDAGDAIDKIKYLTDDNRKLIQRSLSDPLQKSVVQTVAQTVDDVDKADLQHYMEANQRLDNTHGRSFNNLKKKNSTVLAEVQSDKNIQNILRYMGYQENGTTNSANFVQSISNYAKYSAQKTEDFEMNNSSDVIQNFSQKIAKGYDIVSGHNYIFNNNDLALTKERYDALANYMLNSFHKEYVSHGKSEAQYIEYIDNHQLVVTNTPDGDINIVDSQGTVVDRTPYTSHLIHLAEHEIKIVKERRIGLTPQEKLTHDIWRRYID